jgi:hypothetical protein
MSDLTIEDHKTPYHSLWNAVFMVTKCSFTKYQAEEFLPQEKFEDKTKETFQKINKMRSSKYKILPHITEADRVMLSTMGIEGKKYKNTEQKIESDKEFKKFVPFVTETIQVDNFLESYKTYYEENACPSLLSKHFLNLHNQARSLSQDLKVDSSLEEVKAFSTTPIGSFSMIMSMIFQEINLSLTSNAKGK